MYADLGVHATLRAPNPRRSLVRMQGQAPLPGLEDVCLEGHDHRASLTSPEALHEWAHAFIAGSKSLLFAKHASPMGDASTWASDPPGGSVPAVAVVEDRDQLKADTARNLVRLMGEAGMSITRLADDLGVDRSDVRRWRTGKVFPAYKIHAIAEKLGTTVERLTAHEDEAGE